MGHGLAYWSGCGWAVLAILTYYVYAPVDARCPPATCLRRRRPSKWVCDAPPTALSIGVGVAANGLLKLVRGVSPSVFKFGEVKTRCGLFYCPDALQIM